MKYIGYQYTETLEDCYVECIEHNKRIVDFIVEKRPLTNPIKWENSNVDRIELIRTHSDIAYLDLDTKILKPFDDLEPGLWMDFLFGVPHGAVIVSIGNNSAIVEERIAHHKKSLAYKISGRMQPGKVFGRCKQVKQLPDKYFTHGFFTTQRFA